MIKKLLKKMGNASRQHNGKLAVLVVLMAALYLPQITHASLDLKLYNSPPCLLTDQYGNCPDQTTLSGYIQTLYRFGLGIGGILAVGMIIFGAINISISGSVDKEKEGKSYITSALLGLLLLFGAYVLLREINPNLVQLSPPSAPQISFPTSTMTNAMWTDNNQKLAELENAGVEVSSSGNCFDISNPTCTSLAGMPDPAIQFIINLEKNSGCPANSPQGIVVTGGTEVGHQTHGYGLPVFDLRDSSCLVSYIQNNLSSLKSSVERICSIAANSQITFGCGNYVEQEDHIHIALKTQ